MNASYSLREVKNPEEFNPLAIRRDTPFTQGYKYGEWQIQMGRTVRRFLIQKQADVIGTIQIISYPLFRGKNYLYIPHGPVFLTNPDQSLQIFLKEKLRDIALEENAAFVRFDPFPKIETPTIFQKTPKASYYGAYFQSKYDWQMGIEGNEKEILQNMHEKTRYSIGLSKRKDVEVEMILGKQLIQYFEKFYALLEETASRGKFNLHPKEYYKKIFQRKDPDIALFVARYNGEILATHLVYFFGDTAFYPFGGSTEKERNRQPTYALHWEAVLEAKRRGCRFYNFGAIDADPALPHKNWKGISDFKRKFGGNLLVYSDFFDVIAKPFWYYLYNARKFLKRL